MYDEIKCEYPLPHFRQLQDHVFQTKDTPEQYMFSYTITKYGRLVMYRYVSVEKEIIGDEGEKIKATIHTPEGDPIDQNIHGDIFFYTYLRGEELEKYGLNVDDGKDGKWIEYKARFTEGNLQWIKIVSEKVEEKMTSKKVAILEFDSCRECPFKEDSRTPGAGYALDWFCTKDVKRKIASYIEWATEEPKEIPDWCPLVKKE